MRFFKVKTYFSIARYKKKLIQQNNPLFTTLCPIGEFPAPVYGKMRATERVTLLFILCVDYVYVGETTIFEGENTKLK